MTQTPVDAPHTLVVHEVGAPYGPLSTDEFEEFEIVHPDCPMRTVGDDEYSYEVYDCGVGDIADECGVRYSLKYSGTPVDEPGTYQIEYWFTPPSPSRYGEQPGDADCGVVLSEVSGPF